MKACHLYTITYPLARTQHIIQHGLNTHELRYVILILHVLNIG